MRTIKNKVWATTRNTGMNHTREKIYPRIGANVEWRKGNEIFISMEMDNLIPTAANLNSNELKI